MNPYPDSWFDRDNYNYEDEVKSLELTNLVERDYPKFEDLYGLDYTTENIESYIDTLDNEFIDHIESLEPAFRRTLHLAGNTILQRGLRGTSTTPNNFPKFVAETDDTEYLVSAAMFQAAGDDDAAFNNSSWAIEDQTNEIYDHLLDEAETASGHKDMADIYSDFIFNERDRVTTFLGNVITKEILPNIDEAIHNQQDYEADLTDIAYDIEQKQTVGPISGIINSFLF